MLPERLDAIDGLQREHGLLDVGSEQEQVEEERDPCSCEGEPSSDVSAVREDALVNETLDMMGERQHSSDVGRPAYGGMRLRRLPREAHLGASLTDEGTL
jgi:hypothetical protein